MGNKPSKLDRGEILAAVLGGNAVNCKELARMTNVNQILDTGLGLTAIHLAVASKNYDAVKQLVANKTTDVNGRVQGVTCLALAASCSTLQIVKELLKRRDLQVNAVNRDKKVTPLMAAVFEGSDDRSNNLRAEIVDAIVSDPRCNPELMDEDNYTALTYTAHLGNILVAKQLLRDGRAAKYSIAELLGDCKVAVTMGHEAICDLILESLAPFQIIQLQQKFLEIKAATEQREDSQRLLALLHHAATLLDGSSQDTLPSGEPVDSKGREIKVGSVVLMIQDKEKIKELQNGHGGWTENMSEISKHPGIVTSFNKDNDLVVNFLFLQSNSQKLELILNPKIVVVISKDDCEGVDGKGNVMKIGDTVTILSDEQMVKAMQVGHGGWADRMRKLLGKFGQVMYFDHDGDVCVTVAKHPACFSPKVLFLVDSVECDKSTTAKIGDHVQITSSAAEFERLQTPQFGGWNATLQKFVGKKVVVRAIEYNCFYETETPECLIKVYDETNASGSYCSINPKAAVGPTTSKTATAPTAPTAAASVLDAAGARVQVGSVVTFLKDATEVQRLQKGRKGWSDRLVALVVLSKIPVLVTSIKADGDIETAVLAFLTDDHESCISVNPKAITLKSKDGHEALDNTGQTIRKGDTVTLLENEAQFRVLQEKHGGWNDQMKNFLGKPLVIQFFDTDGDIMAFLGEIGKIVYMNPKATRKVDKVTCREGTEAGIGSKVRITVSAAEFERLQTDQFGGWSPSLTQLLNQLVTVKKISCKFKVKTDSPACVIQVYLDQHAFWINPLAVTVEKGSSGSSSGSQIAADSHHDLREIPFEQITLERKIGSGGFGTVYLSKWIATRCAVKHIQASDIIAGAERDRILQEAVTHSRLVHPHIVQFIGISLERTSLYIVLKCVDGFNLDEIVFEKKLQLTAIEKNAIAIQVCDVIRYLHDDARPKVIHQDIKPSNVLIESATKQALITDFGISRLAGRSPSDTVTNLTKLYSSSISGTILYMAPELVIPNANGLHRKPNFQSDIFALGATMAEFLSSRRLYGDNVKDMASLLTKKQSGETPFAVDHVPSQYRALMKRSLTQDPSQRPSAMDMVKSLTTEGNLMK